jgi:hypothetical protein
MLTHTQVIIGAPNGQLMLRAAINRLREVTDAPPEIGEGPISVVPLYDLEMRLNELIEIHCGP